ncbi:MAG: ThiF family adenylyltransferase [Proteobacteria bacterium]|nr:ThiF family adenylyltransferase [Pseudomonadota bacterium]
MVWWNRYPEELEREIHALEVAGMQPQKNEAKFKEGKAEIGIRLKVLGSERDASIVYPDLYPYFRPTLFVPGLGTTLRHYNPHVGEVCLLQRGTQYWLPEMTAAGHIGEMLPHWEQAAVRHYEDSRLAVEDEQAEPATSYYPTEKTQSVMLDSSWRLPKAISSGHIKIVFPKGHKSITQGESFAAWVTEIIGDDKKVIEGVSFTKPIKRWVRAQGYTECKYPWLRLEAPPICSTLQELIEKLVSSDPKVKRHINHQRSLSKNGLYGFCFPEEAPGGGLRDGWLFLAYHCNKGTKRRGGSPVSGSYFWLVGPDYAGEKDLFERVPELHPLRDKTVAIIGLGCVGAPSALAFARAGIRELRLLDGDSVTAGTTCRWPQGLASAGAGKVRELARYISQNHPLTKIGTGHYPYGSKKDCMVRLGDTSSDYDQWDCLEKWLEDVDLVYDATAEQGINLLLNDMVIARGIPYVTVSSRAGGWGGNVVRVRPNSDKGCYHCYLYSLQDEQIAQPSYDPCGDGLQPVGCGDITFKAAGFDVEEVALAGVRMAVSTLTEGATSGYPPIVHDVAVLSLRKDGMAIFPEWQSFHLSKHPNCGICNR